MTTDLLVLLVILGTSFALFVSGRFRLDLVAVAALLALFAAGLVDTDEALAGFSHPLVIMIAGLFIVGGGLFRTGVADAMGRWLERTAGRGIRSMMVSVMLVAAALSAFISSTGTVAVLIPVVIALAHARKVNPSKLMIPLAFGSLFGGMALAAGALFELAQGYGPRVLIIAVFVLTSGLSQLVSNTATTVLAAPIALSASTAMSINPDAVLITVAIAASTAFATPVASPVNTLVYNPGDYRFADFARVGIPLQLLIMVATLIVVPLFFPF